MKPFDLNAALNGAKVVTRDGREVKQLTLFSALDESQPVVGICNHQIEHWDRDGRYHVNTWEETIYDLFMADVDEAPQITTLEGFLEAYYPNYYTSELIARYNDLCVQLEGHETHVNRGAFKEYKEIEDILFKGACDNYRLIHSK
jgi:hypothetical protein